MAYITGTRSVDDARPSTTCAARTRGPSFQHHIRRRGAQGQEPAFQVRTGALEIRMPSTIRGHRYRWVILLLRHARGEPDRDADADTTFQLSRTRIPSCGRFWTGRIQGLSARESSGKAMLRNRLCGARAAVRARRRASKLLCVLSQLWGGTRS